MHAFFGLAGSPRRAACASGLVLYVWSSLDKMPQNLGKHRRTTRIRVRSWIRSINGAARL